MQYSNHRNGRPRWIQADHRWGLTGTLKLEEGKNAGLAQIVKLGALAGCPLMPEEQQDDRSGHRVAAASNTNQSGDNNCEGAKILYAPDAFLEKTLLFKNAQKFLDGAVRQNRSAQLDGIAICYHHIDVHLSLHEKVFHDFEGFSLS